MQCYVYFQLLICTTHNLILFLCHQVTIPINYLRIKKFGPLLIYFFSPNFSTFPFFVFLLFFFPAIMIQIMALIMTHLKKKEKKNSCTQL